MVLLVRHILGLGLISATGAQSSLVAAAAAAWEAIGQLGDTPAIPLLSNPQLLVDISKLRGSAN